MMVTGNPTSAALFSRYVGLLEVEAKAPTTDALCALVRAHVIRWPFENISKLYRVRHLGIRCLPDLSEFLDGMAQYHFGGTCYASNYHFYRLLRHLGFDASFCGADMSAPDVHTVLVVFVDGREYLVDVGFGAPFFAPIPRDLDEDWSLRWGRDSYVLRPKNKQGCSRLDHFRDDALIHGYLVKPEPRELGHFSDVIRDSLSDSAMFMNAIRLQRFLPDGSISLHNYSLSLIQSGEHSARKLASYEDIVATITEQFSIPAEIVRPALAGLTALRDVHT